MSCACHNLNAPRSFFEASEEDKARKTNGCGPQSSILDVVPDHLLGLPIGCACNIHDWMFAEGGGQADKDRADTWFRWNLRILIDEDGGLLRWPRLFLAWWYWRAVSKLGDDAFNWKG